MVVNRCVVGSKVLGTNMYLSINIPPLTLLLFGGEEEMKNKSEMAMLAAPWALDRKMFTRHGMHLSQRGKRKLAGLIQRSLAKMHKLSSRPSHKVSPPSSGEPPSSTMQSPSVSVTTVEPRCLPMPLPAADTVVPCVPPSAATPWTSPHNSYAEAVRSSPTYERSTVVVDEKSNSVFLGTPLGNSGQN
ncbi:hypothetical protein J6590_047794 [Homalodisca vitripennis]|nr:hypothetical protein J6590_047794 [Homalodisca vitripennis]